MKTIENQTVTGLPFVQHVDQNERPTIENAQEFLKRAYVSFFANNDNLIRFGHYKLMGYKYDFRPFLKLYLYKQYGQWNEAFAPNKTTLRNVIGGTITQIKEL